MRGFKNWVEAAINDKPKVVRTWLSSLPPESDTPQIESGVNDFVDAMANEAKNVNGVMQLIRTNNIIPRIMYGPKKICGNLLLANSPLVKEALGMLVHPDKIMFAFGIGAIREMTYDPKGPKEGELLIAFMPITYGMEDRALLAGIIRHELRHAADFITMKDDVKRAGGTETISKIDRHKYLTHIFESRAYSEQIRWMLHLMGNNINIVLTALSNPVLGFDEELRTCAELFLRELIKTPAVRTESHFFEGKDSDKKNVEIAARKLKFILEGLRLRNFVKR